MPKNKFLLKLKVGDSLGDCSSGYGILYVSIHNVHTPKATYVFELNEYVVGHMHSR